MHEHELWVTALLNQYLPAPAQLLRSLLHIPAQHADKPWTNYAAMEVFVVVLLMAAAALLRMQLSMDRPGKVQLVAEAIYTFIRQQAHDIIGHGYEKHVPFFACIFFFILSSNLLGIVPSFESPTMFYVVPAGVALASFCYYNGQGVWAMGPLKYLGHFAGPLWWLWWFMFPLEILSHCIRPMSLTIRLFVNMLAGEQVTVGFMALMPWVVPVVFLGLHTFVSLIQSFIFMMLSIAYVGGAVAHEEH
jgi:F-type H+-transporting ATPase subunit a